MRLDQSFYERDVLQVAPDLIGKILVRNTSSGISVHMITEVEAYGGTEDEASHARFGKTARNKIMFDCGGLVYVYLIYGMYWMLNIVTGPKDHAQAILIRGVENINGPGKVARALGIDRSFYGENLINSTRLWIEDQHIAKPSIRREPRLGINYAGEPWKSKPWRFHLD
jgi:DNA-3-methyladenine glycosylase